ESQEVSCPAHACPARDNDAQPLDGEDACGTCTEPVPVCESGTCRACRVQPKCCVTRASGLRCTWRLCQPTPGGTMDRQGSDTSHGNGSVSVSGNKVTCRPGDDYPRSKSCCSSKGAHVECRRDLLAGCRS